ncbi:uncharacterized protein LOC116618779 [Nematostella vectensis]|uniref:uncharacterized protein LOC116618779 n=1 Tax=Nematostella vectensis TaxID=45351 RepID=UPI0020779B17|nr:uncharacterized protein LOC116618779 [Nematostella vectensis]
MVTSSSRFVVILCVLLLLQEFGQARFAHGPAGRSLSRKKASRGDNTSGDNTPIEDDIEGEEDDGSGNDKTAKERETALSQLKPQTTEQESAGKKGWVSALFKGIQIGTKVGDLVMSVVGMSAAIYGAIKGCGGPLGEPQLETYQKDFETVRDDVQILSDRADTLQQEAERDQLWVQADITEFESVLSKLKKIDDEQDRLIESIHPSVRTSMNTAVARIKTIMKEKNNTADGVLYTELLDGYNSALENAINIGVPALTLAFPAAKGLYNFVKKRQASRKVMDISAANNVDLKVLTGDTNMVKQSKIGGFISRSKSKITKMKKRFNTRFGTAAKFAKSFKKGLSVGLSLATMGFEIFMLIKGREECAKIRELAFEALGNVTKARDTIRDQITDITTHRGIMREAWGYLKSNITDDTFLDSVSDVGVMVDDLKKRSNDMEQVATEIKNFVRDIKGATTNYNLTFDLTKQLNEDLGRVPFTVSCYSAKYRIINRIIAGCKQGQGGRSFDELYNKEQSGYEDNEYDPENPDNCVDKVGFRYIRKQDVESALIDSAQKEGFSTNCKLNDKSLVEAVCVQGEQGWSSANIVVNLARHGIKVTEEEVKEILPNCPLTDEQKQKVCFERKKKSNEEIAEENGFQLKQVEAVTCPWPLTELQKRRVCLYRHRLNKTDAFIADKLKVDVSQVAAVTCPRPSKDSSKKHRRRG